MSLEEATLMTPEATGMVSAAATSAPAASFRNFFLTGWPVQISRVSIEFSPQFVINTFSTEHMNPRK